MKAIINWMSRYPDKLSSRIQPAQRGFVTPTCWHISSTGHVEHFGRVPVQMCLPNGTSRRLISIQ